MAELEDLNIPAEKKKYISQLLNPMLEEMVAACIHKMPKDPVPFMLEWLEEKKVSTDDKMLTPEEKELLARENMSLEANLTKVKSQMQEAAKLAHDHHHHHDEEEESEEDDDDMEPPPDFDRPVQSKARQSVSAEAYGEWNKAKTFVAPVIPKSDDQKDRLKSCLCRSFLFSNLDDNDLNIVIGAMKEKQVEPKSRVINQGDNGDFLFVVEKGQLECMIAQPDGSEKNVKTCTTGDVFGELALLYNCPRAASVESSDKCVLWQLDRDTFNYIVKDAAQKKRARYDAFLSKVPLLQSMDNYERSQLADAVKPEVFSDGQTDVSQGELGTKFFIIEEGEALASKNGMQVMSYGVGDYFGELALIKNQPRAASVKCKGNSRLLSIDSASFKRLLNVKDLLQRATRYS